MKYLAAYCLAALAGKEHPAANDIIAILKSVGIEPAQDHVDKVIEALKGKNLHEVIHHGLGKVSQLAVGGGASHSHAKHDDKGAKKDVKESPKKEAKKEVPKEEPKEEEVDMGGLFDF